MSSRTRFRPVHGNVYEYIGYGVAGKSSIHCHYFIVEKVKAHIICTRILMAVFYKPDFLSVRSTTVEQGRGSPDISGWHDKTDFRPEVEIHTEGRDPAINCPADDI